MSYMVTEYTLRDYGLPGEGIKDTNLGNKGNEMIYHHRRFSKKCQKLRDTLNKSLWYLFFNIIFVPFLKDPNIPSKHI